VARLGEQLARGLAAVHARGLVHRDVKPGNTWLEQPRPQPEGQPVRPPQVKLMDFGLVRGGDSPSGGAGLLVVSQPGMVLGTLPYMAPEQAEDPRRADARSDLFSLGCVLYEAVTGRPAFHGPDAMALLRQLAIHHPPPPAEVNPAVPRGLSDLIVELLAKDPAARPGSAAAVADRLRALTLPPPPKGSARPPRRLAIAGGVLASVLLAAAALWFARTPGTGPAPAPAVRLDPKLVETDPDRAVAKWAQELKAESITLNDWEKDVKPGEPLPDERFTLTALDFRGTLLTDDDLAQLRKVKLPSLSAVNLGGVETVTEASLEHLARYPLTDLTLPRNLHITEAGAKQLSEMTYLAHVFLAGTEMTDSGLVHLQRLRHLKILDIQDVRGISQEGVKRLRGALPACKVQDDFTRED
jgi:hypothetical protein